MSDTLYFILCGILGLGVLIGLSLLSKVKTSIAGNMISIFCTLGAIVITLIKYQLLSEIGILAALVAGLAFGTWWSFKIKMIQMPQVVALLNGFGGAAAALVAIVTLVDAPGLSLFALFTGGLALVVGSLTFTGSLVAAGKLHKILPQKSVVWKGHQAITTVALILTIVSVIAISVPSDLLPLYVFLGLLVSGFFGVAFTIRVGGADMPITISLLVSLSGVADGIAGMAIENVLLVVLGGIVGASGLLLTKVMCMAMNRRLSDILTGKTTVSTAVPVKRPDLAPVAVSEPVPSSSEDNVSTIMKNAKRVIIVPGYGMALAQAQQKVRALADVLEANGAVVDFAIHPVAGRMPGHMNVLLAEADVPYEKLRSMDEINDEFENTDLAIVVGANDVINPAANTAVDTPIYGMPILNVEKAKNAIICNYDLMPGYAGVDNPLYHKDEVIMMLGNAEETVQDLINKLNSKEETLLNEGSPSEDPVPSILKNAKRVIIVPGYGMALAQAQQKVRALADALEANGAVVDFAIHPVAGRMPGHMNVLLAEADVPYEKLRSMDEINDEFENTDLAIVVGANDVINPAANTAVDTPIYGMPILNVEKAKNAIICNYDLMPGYAGVDNPLYHKDEVIMMLGNAEETVQELIEKLSSKTQDSGESESADQAKENRLSTIMRNAKRVIIVPGYGMALAQAQQKVRALADALEANGAVVDFAIHPVAGRMPGHMNVLLAEADVPYEKLRSMDEINDEFEKADLAIVVGANDVINPAANTAVDTPIYGMPILNVEKAKNAIICNYDLMSGYAGVDNPLYHKDEVIMMLGNAEETVQELINKL